MFAQIRSVVEVLVSGFKGLREFKSEKDREAAIVGLLRFYFLLKECVEEAEALIADAGNDPVGKIGTLSPADALQVAKHWDAALRRQAGRLYALQGLLFAQDALAVINPELEASISKAVGYKMQRAVTLHGIGSVLVIRCMFPFEESPAEMGQLILTMAGERTRKTLNLKRIRQEVEGLKNALECYRKHVEAVATVEEIVKFSAKARKASRAAPQEA
jgi:hypothetical protein